MPLNNHERAYACKCLNVRIQPHPPPLVSAESESVTVNADYTRVFVGDDGITVVHPQVTLRTRSPGIPIVGTSRCTRYTSLTCLVCHTLVYHVHQVVQLEVEGKDGPQLPTDDWVEQEIMKSVNGWIEVHKDCLVGDAITQAESSTSYSTLFKVVLPSSPSCTPSPEQPHTTPTETLSTRPLPRSKSYLSDMKSLFPPPPFTPSHPVFLHLSLVASSNSQALRESAEEHLNDVVAEKVKEIEESEDQIRRHVEILWKAFREGVNGLERGTSQNRPARQKDLENLSVSSDGTNGSIKRVAVRDFVPLPSPPARVPVASSLPRVSSLSSSLATSSFHHPRAVRTPPLLPALREGSPPSSASGGSSPSGSRTLSSPSVTSSLTLRPQSEGRNILEPFRRNMDQARDTAASFRYFTNLEADMARARQQAQVTTGTKTDAVQTLPGLAPRSPGPTPARSSITNGTNGHRKPPRKYRSSSQSSREDSVTNEERPAVVSGGGPTNGPLINGSKGKRKVTFDVKPDVVTIKREVNAEKEQEAAEAVRETGEMMFDLEDERSELSSSDHATRPVESVQAPAQAPRSRINRSHSTQVLPEFLSSLRPASLPAPSHVRSPRSFAESSSQTVRAPPMLQLVRDSTRHSTPRLEPEVPEEPEPLDPREAEILKLVAADTPSHRGAWKRDSKAWKLFVRRQDDKSGYSGAIPEEGEGGDDPAFGIRGSQYDSEDDDGELGAQNGINHMSSAIIGSLPIAINPLSRPRPALSLASYRPDAPISNHAEVVSPRLSSTAALRKASYAERDRSRSMDPGALDFDAADEEDDEDEESDGDGEKPSALDAGERGRKMALKILQARSELPAPGMWRSLA